MNTMEILISSARNSAADMYPKMSAEIFATLLAANNQMLKAAIIENGGELLIHSESFYKMLHDPLHVAAATDDEGCVTLSLVTKNVLDDSECALVPL
jgi:hypothetical protein